MATVNEAFAEWMLHGILPDGDTISAYRAAFLAGAAWKQAQDLADADQKIVADTDLFNAGYETGAAHQRAQDLAAVEAVLEGGIAPSDDWHGFRLACEEIIRRINEDTNDDNR